MHSHRARANTHPCVYLQTHGVAYGLGWRAKTGVGPCACYCRARVAVQTVAGVLAQGLFALARDASSQVRRAVCTGLVQMLHLVPEKLAPHMRDIIEYMLESTQVRSL